MSTISIASHGRSPDHVCTTYRHAKSIAGIKQHDLGLVCGYISVFRVHSNQLACQCTVPVTESWHHTKKPWAKIKLTFDMSTHM